MTVSSVVSISTSGDDWISQIRTAPSSTTGSEINVRSAAGECSQAALGAGNVVNVLFNLSGLAPVEQGTFKGEFFTDLNTNFFSNVSSGSFAYWVTGTYGSAGGGRPD